MASWSIAMSGGGHRASLFGLGALLYVADAGLNAEVTSMASVSGGSLTNGYVGAKLDFTTASPADFENAMRPLAKRCAVQGTVQWAWEAVLLLVGIVLGVALAVVAWFLPVATWLSVLLFVIGLVVALGLTQARSWVADLVLRRLLFPGKHLGDLHTSVTHVMCATEVQSKLHAYFSRDFVYSYEYGLSTGAGRMQLSTAVQASACLPGAFAPRTISSRSLGFGAAAHRWMWLVDGGVYDNMGDQWAQGFAERAARDPAFATVAGTAPDNLVVVNSSGRGGWGAASWLMRVPALGELITFLREKSILYQVGTTTRRSSEVTQFDTVRYLRAQPQSAERDVVLGELGPCGTLVHIGTSPRWVENATHVTPAEHARCAAVAAKIAAFGDDAWIDSTCRRSPSVKTTLAALGRADSAGLLWHGYALAMANLHVFFDTPLLDLPTRQRFEAMLG
jgi:hypothetical protein